MPEQDTAKCLRCAAPLAQPDLATQVFEGMHYVCFHYVFEHTGDVDEPCLAGGCPSAALSGRGPHGASDPAMTALVQVDGSRVGEPAEQVRFQRLSATEARLQVGEHRWLIVVTPVSDSD